MLLDEAALPQYARGAAILGAGGGGSTGNGLLGALQAVQELGPVEVIPLSEVPDDGWILPLASLGSPDITLEKLGNPRQGVWLREMIEAETGEPAFAMMPSEIGGANALLPVIWAAHSGLPLIDADGMGRAYPEVQMVSMHLAGIAATPAAMVDERGHQTMFRSMEAVWLERVARAAAVAYGGIACTADHIMTGAQARTGAVVEGSITRAMEIGELLSTARGEGLASVIGHLDGTVVMSGKITDVHRRNLDGFVRGEVIVDGIGADKGRVVRVEIQNENLAVLEEGRVLASVPDIITMLDSHTGDAIFTELLRYGQRVTLVTLPAPPIWRTQAGLELVGPRAFGYDFDYRPTGRNGGTPKGAVA